MNGIEAADGDVVIVDVRALHGWLSHLQVFSSSSLLHQRRRSAHRILHLESMLSMEF